MAGAHGAECRQVRIDARAVAVEVIVQIAAAILVAYLVRRIPALRQLTERAP